MIGYFDPTLAAVPSVDGMKETIRIDGMALQLRKACVTDLPAIYRGEESYILTWEPAHEASWRSDLERHLTRWTENFDHLKIAVIVDAFAGYSLWIPEGNYAELCTLHVAPDFRRSSVGTKLLEAYMFDAACQGFTQLRLSVRPDNPARVMYENAGFLCVSSGANGYLIYERCL
ncbi:GNAT family N-acetyltransferase [Pseudomonas sp. MLB6B]